MVIGGPLHNAIYTAYVVYIRVCVRACLSIYALRLGEKNLVFEIDFLFHYYHYRYYYDYYYYYSHTSFIVHYVCAVITTLLRKAYIPSMRIPR